MPPALIAVSEFVEETRSDYNSPTTSTFASRMPDCRQTIAILEEVSMGPPGQVAGFPKSTYLSLNPSGFPEVL